MKKKSYYNLAVAGYGQTRPLMFVTLKQRAKVSHQNNANRQSFFNAKSQTKKVNCNATPNSYQKQNTIKLGEIKVRLGMEQDTRTLGARCEKGAVTIGDKEDDS